MKYSLIIPIYNEGKSLPLLINKLKMLDNDRIEIIIIDDGSDDDTKEILRKHGTHTKGILRKDIRNMKGTLKKY